MNGGTGAIEGRFLLALASKTRMFVSDDVHDTIQRIQSTRVVSDQRIANSVKGKII
jgi:hypothetical protein